MGLYKVKQYAACPESMLTSCTRCSTYYMFLNVSQLDITMSLTLIHIVLGKPCLDISFTPFTYKLHCCSVCTMIISVLAIFEQAR